MWNKQIKKDIESLKKDKASSGVVAMLLRELGYNVDESSQTFREPLLGTRLHVLEEEVKKIGRMLSNKAGEEVKTKRKYIRKLHVKSGEKRPIGRPKMYKYRPGETWAQHRSRLDKQMIYNAKYQARKMAGLIGKKSL